ncbi:MAG: hypothetical protein PHU12_00010 [Candidatus Aenigmarchaeota archaeon]|nr:hypothetical protein [Candidatus Aenigmarchaeota archaeon]
MYRINKVKTGKIGITIETDEGIYIFPKDSEIGRRADKGRYLEVIDIGNNEYAAKLYVNVSKGKRRVGESTIKVIKPIKIAKQTKQEKLI